MDTLDPVKVRAVVAPDLIIKLPLLLVAEPNVVPPSLKNISHPSASRFISSYTSKFIDVAPPVVELIV